MLPVLAGIAQKSNKGPQVYKNFKTKLSTSAFKKSGKTVKLPVSWAFIKNSVPVEKLKKAKYIMVDFWFTACGPCVKEFPDLNAFYNKLRHRDDVLFLSVNTDYVNGEHDKDYVLKRADKLKVAFPIYYDEATLALNKQLGIAGYPAKYIFSANGDVLEKKDHSIMTLDSFQEFLNELL